MSDKEYEYVPGRLGVGIWKPCPICGSTSFSEVKYGLNSDKRHPTLYNPLKVRNECGATGDILATTTDMITMHYILEYGYE